MIDIPEPDLKMMREDWRIPRDWLRPWLDHPGLVCCCTGACTNGTISNIYLTTGNPAINLQEAYSISGNSWTGKTAATITVIGGIPRGVQACSVSAEFVIGGNTGAPAKKATQEYVDDTWTTKTASSHVYNEHSVLSDLSGVNVYAANTAQDGGSLTHDRYNIAGDSWSVRTDYPQRQTNCQYGNLSDSLYYAGGANSTGTTLTTHESYNIGTDGYTSETAITVAKQNGSQFTFPTYYHAALGINGTGVEVLTNYRFSSSTWTTKTAATNAHNEGTSTSSSTVGYSFSGFDITSAQSTKTDSYDPSGDSWTNKHDTIGFRELGAAAGI